MGSEILSLLGHQIRIQSLMSDFHSVFVQNRRESYDTKQPVSKPCLSFKSPFCAVFTAGCKLGENQFENCWTTGQKTSIKIG